MRAAMERFAADENLDLVDVVIELDRSGNKTNESAELERLIRRIESGELAGLVVPKLDRLSRLPPKQRIELVERIGTERLLSATESNDVSTPEGRFVREVFFALARMEWERAAENVLLAKTNAINRGVAIARQYAYGLRFDAEHRYVPGPAKERRTLVELFELRLGGASYIDLALHFKRRTGRSIAPQTISDMLRNRVYIGEIRHGAGLVNTAAHDAVVPPELFEAVQAVSAERSKPTGWNGRRKALLAGIATCEACRSGLTRSTSNKGASVVYRCINRECTARASIDLATLEAYVIERVLEWVGPEADEVVEVELSRLGDRVVAEHRLDEARASLLAWASDLDREDELGAEAYQAGLQARQARVELRERELAALGEATEVEAVRSTLRELLADTDADVDEKRRLLAIALDSVVVRRTPYFRAPVEERVRVTLAADAAPGSGDENGSELLDHAPTQ